MPATPYKRSIKMLGMICSMSRKENCWDNEQTESWFNSFKNERVFGEHFATRDGMNTMAFQYIKVFYNRQRLHSTLGYRSPSRFLSDWLREQVPEKQVARPAPVGGRKTEGTSITRRKMQ